MMAKVTAPLFSLAAHGTVGDAVTYSKRRTHNHVRYQKKQKDNPSYSQNMQRIKFGAASRLWANLTQEQKDQLEEELGGG